MFTLSCLVEGLSTTDFFFSRMKRKVYDLFLAFQGYATRLVLAVCFFFFIYFHFLFAVPFMFFGKKKIYVKPPSVVILGLPSLGAMSLTGAY